MAGYSGTPLPQKLGIKDGHTVVLLAAPADFDDTLGPLPTGARVRRQLRGRGDVVVVFVTAAADLAGRIDRLGDAIRPDGSLWVAWPKKSSGAKTDMTEQTVRDIALPLGLVDNKVCAIDDTWSGLRLVWRRELRA